MCRASLLLAELRGGVQGSAYELERAFISSLRISLPMPLWIWQEGKSHLALFLSLPSPLWHITDGHSIPWHGPGIS